MAKPTCLKCSAVATIAGLCSKCWRNSRAEVPVVHRPEPPYETLRPAVSYETAPVVSNETSCEGPGCPEMLTQQSTGRRKRFCSARCRVRFNNTKD